MVNFEFIAKAEKSEFRKSFLLIEGEGGGNRLYTSSFHAVASILRNEGVRGIYAGLSAGLLRQATYTTTRMGLYQMLLEKLGSVVDAQKVFDFN